jgi:predicted PurR-regulated permease PerM
MNSSSSTVNTIVILAIVVGTLFFAREVLIPIALACILSFMLAPLVRMLQKLRVSRGAAVIVVVLLAFSTMFALGGVMARHVTELAKELPRYQETISTKIQKLRGKQTGTIEALERAREALNGLQNILNNLSVQAPPQASKAELVVGKDRTLIPVEVHQPSGGLLLTNLVSPLLGPLETTGIIIVFVIFFLVQHEDLRNRLIGLAGSANIPHTTAVIDEAAHRLSQLFLTQLAINSGFAILIGVGLWYIEMPTPFLWGSVAGVLRFIPYVGPVLGAVFPLALAVSVDPGWSMVVWTGALFLCLEVATGQFVEPWVEAHSTGLSPVAVVVAATFWLWLWGPVGLVLATPLTVILATLGRRVRVLKFFDVLFGEGPVLSEAECFYQRMLARDPVEAVEHAKSFLVMHSLDEYCDDVARRGVMLAQRDADRSILEGSNKKALRKTIEAVFADIAYECALATTKSATELPLLRKDHLNSTWRTDKPLLVIGVHSELDEATAAILATLAQTRGIATRIERPKALMATNLVKLDLSGAALICLCSVNAKNRTRIYYAARRIKSRAPDAKLLLGIWSEDEGDTLSSLKDAILADYAVDTFGEAMSIILQAATTEQERGREGDRVDRKSSLVLNR